MNLFEYLGDLGNWSRPGTGIVTRLAEHVLLTVTSIGIAAVVGIPLGVLAARARVARFAVTALSAFARTVPTLGLVVAMVLLIGSGRAGVVVPLVLLAVPTVLASTTAGVRAVDPEARHAGRALGLNPVQVLGSIELPLALPMILTGLRTATLLVIATVTVAAYAGAAGLGRFIVDGQRQGPGGYPQMFTGALVVTALALAVHLLLGAAAWAAARAGARPVPLDDLVVAPAS